MIIRPRPHWFRMLFVMRGSILGKIAPQLLAVTVVALLATLAHGRFFEWKVPLTFVPFSLVGLTLAIFLGFRNSTSYARFWEARTLWGGLQTNARTLLRQGLTQVDRAAGREADLNGPVSGRELASLLSAFVHALRHQLRGTDPRSDLARLIDPPRVERAMSARFRPAILLLMMGEWVHARRREGRLSDIAASSMETTLAHLCEGLGGCERIASTPIPFTYAVIIHRTIYVYCFLLPFGLVDAIGWMTPVFVAFIAYTFFALEALGDEIEDPFGTQPNDLALDTMTNTIEATLREMTGEALPEPIAPKNGVFLT